MVRYLFAWFEIPSCENGVVQFSAESKPTVIF